MTKRFWRRNNPSKPAFAASEGRIHIMNRMVHQNRKLNWLILHPFRLLTFSLDQMLFLLGMRRVENFNFTVSRKKKVMAVLGTVGPARFIPERLPHECPPAITRTTNKMKLMPLSLLRIRFRTKNDCLPEMFPIMCRTPFTFK